MLRYFLITLGLLSTGLAVLGMFLPLLPTVPFLLLAAWCFARSSARFYTWLVSHPRLGPIVCTYLNGEGVPLRAKVITIAVLWISIGVSVWLMEPVWVRVLLGSVGAGVTFYMLSLPGEVEVITRVEKEKR
ncbi:MAG: YbaN family protein [Desulfuromonadaceae bacterium]|nr:YbaN family protein [Desulfuromonadaceae bacterium]